MQVRGRRYIFILTDIIYNKIYTQGIDFVYLPTVETLLASRHLASPLLVPPLSPKGARYIWCVRELCAVVYSFFKLFEGWMFQLGEVSVKDFVGGLWLPVTVGSLNKSTMWLWSKHHSHGCIVYHN